MSNQRWGILPGVRLGHIRQGRRPRDGVRGLFTTRPIPCGALLLDVPRQYCYFPRGLGPYDTKVPDGADALSQYSASLRRLNRPTWLLPETWMWLQRLAPNAEENCVSLSAYTSVVDVNVLNEAAGDSVVSITLTTVEAALAVSVALRFFYTHVAHLSIQARTSLHIGPPPSHLADLYVDSLPLHQFLLMGVESLFPMSGGVEANAHSGLEQIAHNLRDAVLSHATHQEYSLLDAHSDVVDDVLLAAIYIVRARCLPVRLLSPAQQGTSDRVVSVLAPGLDRLNHASRRCSAQAAVYSRGVVVRAARMLQAGEEITIDYGLRSGGTTQTRPVSVVEPLVADNWEEGRYLLNMGDRE